jgi:hypothetical protein
LAVVVLAALQTTRAAPEARHRLALIAVLLVVAAALTVSTIPGQRVLTEAALLEI